MRAFSRLSTFIIAVLLLWLTDSLLLSLAAGIPWIAACWSAVPAWRLLLRLLLTGLLLLAGFMLSLRREITFRQYQQLPASSRARLFGDPEAAEAASRVQYHALRLAALLKLNRREQDKLRLLCYCYDMGMVGVPRAVLEKDGSLDQREQRAWDRHIELGAEIASCIPALAKAAPLIACHEEDYDGHGPRGVFGRSIPLACRIFRVVGLYDTFTHPHAGGRVMDDAEALDELELFAGTALDPEVVEAFRRLLTDGKIAAAAMRYVASYY